MANVASLAAPRGDVHAGQRRRLAAVGTGEQPGASRSSPPTTTVPTADHGQWRDPGQHGLQSVRRSVGWGGDRTRPRRSGVGRHARGMHGAASVQDQPGHGTCDRHGPWRRTIHSRREGEARHGRTAARAPRHPGPARARRDADGPAARVRAGETPGQRLRGRATPHRARPDHQPAVHRGVHGGGPGAAWRRAGAGGGDPGRVTPRRCCRSSPPTSTASSWKGELHARSAGTLARLGYRNIHLRHGDGFLGWPEAAPFDAILLSCAAEEIPGPLWDQLREGGRFLYPKETTLGFQELVVVTRTAGAPVVRPLAPVRFVPLRRAP